MNETEGPLAADADDATDPLAHCRHRRKPLWPGQPPAWCDQPPGHWPGSDHHWIETLPDTPSDTLPRHVDDALTDMPPRKIAHMENIELPEDDR